MMEAKKFLKRLRKIDKMIVNKESEIEQWKSIAEGTTAQIGGERVQSSGSQQKMADAVCKYTAIQEKVKKFRDELIEVKQDVIAVIESLESATEYDVLHKMYVGKVLQREDGSEYNHYFEFQEVADMYDRQYSWATTIHGRALKNVQRILDSRKE
jgi:dynactin complex subunit